MKIGDIIKLSGGNENAVGTIYNIIESRVFYFDKNHNSRVTTKKECYVVASLNVTVCSKTSIVRMICKTDYQCGNSRYGMYISDELIYIVFVAIRDLLFQRTYS